MANKKYRRRRHEYSLWAEFRFEIFIIFLFLLGIFLIVEEMEIKATLFYWLTYFLRSMAEEIYSMARWTRDLIQQVETSDIVGIILIITAITLLTVRVRKKIMYRYSNLYSCPDCQGDLHRIHRATSHKILEILMFAKFKHFQCKQCGYKGIRITER